MTAGTTASATVTLTDDDKRGVMVSETELTIPEGKSDSYTVALSSEPTAAVTVTVNGSDGTHLTAPSEGQGLTFPAQNWSVPHTVTVTAAADADAVVPPDVALTHTVAGGDYAGESAGSVTVRTTELTVPELTLSPSAGDGVGERGRRRADVDGDAERDEQRDGDGGLCDVGRNGGVGSGLHGGVGDVELRAGRGADADLHGADPGRHARRGRRDVHGVAQRSGAGDGGVGARRR